MFGFLNAFTPAAPRRETFSGRCRPHRKAGKGGREKADAGERKADGGESGEPEGLPPSLAWDKLRDSDWPA